MSTYIWRYPEKPHHRQLWLGSPLRSQSKDAQKKPKNQVKIKSVWIHTCQLVGTFNQQLKTDSPIVMCTAVFLRPMRGKQFELTTLCCSNTLNVAFLRILVVSIQRHQHQCMFALCVDIYIDDAETPMWCLSLHDYCKYFGLAKSNKQFTLWISLNSMPM